MRIIPSRRKTIVISVVAFFVVIVGVAAAIGATRTRGHGDVAGFASTLPAAGDEAWSDRTPVGEADKSGAEQADGAQGSALGDINAALPPLSTSGHYLVRSGQLTIVVGRGTLHETVGRITLLTRGYDGYVLASMVGTWSDDGDVTPYPAPLQGQGEDAVVSSPDARVAAPAGGQPYGYVTVRIPADRFDDALARFQKLGAVRELTTNTDDVTSQLVDLRARLRHYRAVEERLLSFLDKANTVAAALAVQDRIDQTQLMVEQIEAQIKQLDETVAYSTLSVSLSEKGAASTAIDGSDGFWGAITHSLRLVGDGFRWIGVALGAALPFLAVFGCAGAVVFFLVRRFSRRRRHDRPSAPPSPLATGGPTPAGGGETS